MEEPQVQVVYSERDSLEIQKKLKDITNKAVNSAFTFEIDDCLKDYFEIVKNDPNVHSLQTILEYRLELEKENFKANQPKTEQSLLAICVPALISIFIAALLYSSSPL